MCDLKALAPIDIMQTVAKPFNSTEMKDGNVVNLMPTISKTEQEFCPDCGEKIVEIIGHCIACYGAQLPPMEAKQAHQYEVPESIKKEASNEVTAEDGYLWGVPPLPKSCVLVPNSIARSALFGSKSGDFCRMSKNVKTSQKTLAIKHKGKVLGHEHFLLWSACLALAAELQTPEFRLKRCDFTKRAHIKASHAKLTQLFNDLRQAKIMVGTKVLGVEKHFTGRLLQKFRNHKHSNGEVSIKLDTQLAELIRDDYTIMNAAKNEAIQNRMARVLHPYFESHYARKRKPSTIMLTTLKELCQSSAGDARNQFPYHLCKALDELLAHRIIEGYEMLKSSKGTSIKWWKKSKKDKAV